MPPLDSTDDSNELDLRGTIESVVDSDTTSTETPTAAPPPEREPGQPPEGATRDGLGRFVSKEKPQEPAGGPGVSGSPIPPAQPATGAPGASQAGAQPLPAPVAWGPQAREYWGQVPPPVQQEVARRETEMQRMLGETAQARDIAQRFVSMVQPHMMTIQAEGVDPFTAVGNLMQATTMLRMGTTQEKAGLIAHLVRHYGVDIESLDAALVGQPMPHNGNSQDVQQAVQQALAPLWEAAQSRQQMAAQQADMAARGDLEGFAADPHNEFLGDLRYIMADLMEVAQRQGRGMTLREAYDTAAQLHPEVSKVILARQQGVNARQLTQAAQRARGAAVSVRGSAPSGSPNGPEPSSIRESIEAAIETHSRY